VLPRTKGQGLEWSVVLPRTKGQGLEWSIVLPRTKDHGLEWSIVLPRTKGHGLEWSVVLPRTKGQGLEWSIVLPWTKGHGLEWSVVLPRTKGHGLEWSVVLPRTKGQGLEWSIVLPRTKGQGLKWSRSMKKRAAADDDQEINRYREHLANSNDSTSLWSCLVTGGDLGWGPQRPEPPTNTGQDLPPSLLTQGRIGLFWTSELSNPIQCVLTGSGSPLCPHLNITFTYKLKLVTVRLVIR